MGKCPAYDRSRVSSASARHTIAKDLGRKADASETTRHGPHREKITKVARKVTLAFGRERMLIKSDELSEPGLVEPLPDLAER